MKLILLTPLDLSIAALLVLGLAGISWRLRLGVERQLLLSIVDTAWKDHLQLTTWSRGNEGIFYIRDFIISDLQGNPLVNASSSWAAINIRSRRPELVKGLEEGLYSYKEKRAIDDPPGKLPGNVFVSGHFKKYQHVYRAGRGGPFCSFHYHACQLAAL